MTYRGRQRNKRCGAENDGEVLDVKDLPDVMAGVSNTGAVPCPGVCLEGSLRRRGWGSGRTGLPEVVAFACVSAVALQGKKECQPINSDGAGFLLFIC